MITTASTCRDCHSTQLVRNGKTRAGNQRYQCKACGSTKVLILDPKYGVERQALVARTYLERNSSRSTARIFGISHRTVLNWLKKSSSVAAFENDDAEGSAGRSPGSR